MVEQRRSQVITQVKQDFRKKLDDIESMHSSLVAALKRGRTIFPKKNQNEAFDYIKSIEKVIDFQSDMIGIRSDTIEALLDQAKQDCQGLGQQRIMFIHSKAFGLLNSLHIDFSGQIFSLNEKLSQVGKVVNAHHPNIASQLSKQVTEIAKSTISVGQIEGSKILSPDYTRDQQVFKLLPSFINNPKLIFRWSEQPEFSNRKFHELCDK